MEVDIFSTVFNYGFPSAIAGYVIVKMDKTMQQLVIAVNSLKDMLENK